MKQIILDWWRRNFSRPEAVVTLILFVLGFLVLRYLGDVLGPIIASLAIAYVLDDMVEYADRFVEKFIKRRDLSRAVAVGAVFLFFTLFTIFLVLGITPALSEQFARLMNEIPQMIQSLQNFVNQMQERHPEFLKEEQLSGVFSFLQSQGAALGKTLLSKTIAFIPNIINMTVYLVTVPILVFFFLKDKETIRKWLEGYLPKERSLFVNILKQVDKETGHYIRGKTIEIVVVAIATTLAFAALGMPYALLLGVLNGLSNLIPYLGAVFVTVPVVLVAFVEWGMGTHFWWVMAVFTLIQLLDGNVLVPFLLSEVMNMHPIVVMGSVIVFGGLWGFWGVFFAIPMASLVHAILSAWPRAPEEKPAATASSEQGPTASAP